MSRKIEIIHTPTETVIPDEYLEFLCGVCFRYWDRSFSTLVVVINIFTGEVIRQVDSKDPNYFIVDAKDVFDAMRVRDPETYAWFMKQQFANVRVFTFERKICREV